MISPIKKHLQNQQERHLNLMLIMPKVKEEGSTIKTKFVLI